MQYLFGMSTVHNNERFLDEDDFYNPDRIKTLRQIEEKILKQLNIDIFRQHPHSVMAKGRDAYQQDFEWRRNKIPRKKRRHKRHVIRGVESLSKGLEVLNMKYTVPALYDESTVDAANDMEIGEGNTECIEDDRIDLRLLNVFTIDPPDAKDLDDAISLKRTSDGFRVGVHIADVSSVVPKDSHIDVEAQHRATTFCPPSSCRPRHMLPEPLGTDMCSLLENKNRRAISVFFSFADDGTLNKTDNSSSIDIKRTMVRSRKQFTYKEIQTIIETPDTDTKDDIARDVKVLFKLSRSIRFKRLGNAMYAMNVQQSFEGCTEAHYLVEEFMIMTNKAVAQHF
ncbi:RNR-like protein [Mya arenaria]|uniref:RNR-like protein n=1 Tax=Mya arenaria TaxID=6604 RepID=A0ABY7F276_MYAAR|nr:RNR-like protein [Mya arenaria]